MSEHIKHIRQTHAERKQLAWCGRSVEIEWAFVDIDHAAYSQLNNDRLLPCKDCLKAVVKALYHQIEK